MSKNSEEKCLSLRDGCVKWFWTNVGKSWKFGWKKCDEGMKKKIHFVDRTFSKQNEKNWKCFKCF